MNILSYIKELTAEVKSNIESDFNFNDGVFKDFSSFDYVNFYLIYQYILKEKKDDFFISIPEDEYRPNFFASIFHSLVLIKLFQNDFNYQNSEPKLQKNDLIYSSSRKRVFEVIRMFNETITVKYKFPKGKEGENPFTIKGHRFTKINPNLSNGRNTAPNIANYELFLKNTFNEKFPFLTEFINRTLVIAEKDFFNESKHLPIRYTNRNGNISNDLPFFNYLIECCNTFQAAKEFLLDKSEIFDEIIIIGDTKYRDCFYDILQECKWKGKVKNIIAIGSEKPSKEHSFVQWLWSNQEIRIANQEDIKTIRKEKIKFEELYNNLIELAELIKQYKEDFGVDLYFVLKYLTFFYKIIVVDSNISKGMYQDYVDRLLHYFSNDKFEEELNQTFFKNDIYNRSQINDCKANIIEHFKIISETLQNKNPKWNFIVKKSKEIPRLYLIVEKKSYDIMHNQLKRQNLNNIILVSDKRIDGKIIYLDKCFNDELNTENKVYVIPHLNNALLLNRIYELKGKIHVLCYEDIDEIIVNRILKNKLADEKARITHKDRNEFVKTKITFNEKEVKINPLNALFEFDLSSIENNNNNNDVLELPKEKIVYDIVFTDGSSEKFESTKGVFLIDNNEQIKTSVGELYEGAKIRFYQNNNPAEFKRILKIFDTDCLLESFDKFAFSWKETLKKLAHRYRDTETLYDKLFDDSNRINLVTFKKYFENDSVTRFPRIKVLNAIKALCEKADLKHELIVTDYDKFVVYSKKDHSIRQQAGRLLGSDLIDYVASNRTEKSESLSKLSDEIIEKLVNTIVEKVIKKKIISDEE
jgi:hypothetical protein